jgi:hypothetical protein
MNLYKLLMFCIAMKTLMTAGLTLGETQGIVAGSLIRFLQALNQLLPCSLGSGPQAT